MSRYISPYISSWELLARFSEGDSSGALRLMRRLFGHMTTHDPASTMWEKLAPGGAPEATPGSSGPGATSLAHGWSTGSVPALSGYVLGLRPTAPGWRRWTVAPQPSGLRFAQGQVGTPHGPLASRWSLDRARRSFRLTASAPRGTSGTVAVPLLGEDRTVACDGRIVWPHSKRRGGRIVRRQDVVVVPERAGIHTCASIRR